MQAHDIQLRMAATDSHWQVGRAEVHGKILKSMLSRMDAEDAISSPEAFRRSLLQAVGAKNALSRVKGFTPEQAVLGVARRLPASVTSSEDLPSHALASTPGPEGDEFRKGLEARTRARRAFIEADNSSSLRRALLRRPRPLRDQFEPGDWMLYWRRKGGNLRRERGQWCGPARVALVESRHVIWLTHAQKLIRASPEQLRPASLREWAQVRQVTEGSQAGPTVVRPAGEHPDFLELGDDVYEPSRDDELESIPEPEREVTEGPAIGADTSRVDTADPAAAPDSPIEPVDGATVPVPSDGFSEEEEPLMFGDCLECGAPSNVMWEIDVTPPEASWPAVAGETWDEVVCMAADQRKKRAEIRLSELGSQDQLRFAVAKHKELKAWLHHKTVRRVARGKIPEHAVMRCRWLLSWKTASGDEPPGDLNEKGQKAKARLIVIGYEDPDIDTIANDAPTLSKDGRMTVPQQVAAHKWPLISFDISTAFLHGKGDGRLLGLRPTPELAEALHLDPGDQVQLDGGAYGRVDAPYLWYCELRDELVKQGCMQCPLDPCVFTYCTENAEGQLTPHGSLGVHVDDGIAGGDEEFMAMLKRLEKRFKFGAFDRGEFVYTGIRFRQWDDFSIEYDQIEYVKGIRPIEVSKQRRADGSAAVTEQERTAYRSLLGALQYAAVHSRPDLSAKVGAMQARVKSAVVEDLLVANRVLLEAKQHEVSLMVLPIHHKHVTYCAFSDASFAAIQDGAHQGSLIFATTPELLKNEQAVVAPVAWSSKKIPRVVRSTLGAEAAALSSAVDRLM